MADFQVRKEKYYRIYCPTSKPLCWFNLELSRNALRIRGLSEGILSAFGFGVLLINQDSDVLMQNELASAILASQNTVKVVDNHVIAQGSERLTSSLRKLKKSLAEGPAADGFF